MCRSYVMATTAHSGEEQKQSTDSKRQDKDEALPFPEQRCCARGSVHRPASLPAASDFDVVASIAFNLSDT
jgi:hypothetical protein